MKAGRNLKEQLFMNFQEKKLSYRGLFFFKLVPAVLREGGVKTKRHNITCVEQGLVPESCCDILVDVNND